jgi:surface antigen
MTLSGPAPTISAPLLDHGTSGPTRPRRRRRRGLVRAVLALAATLAGLVLAVAPAGPAAAAVIGDNYPQRGAGGGPNTQDAWYYRGSQRSGYGYYYRNCTDFVAFRLAKTNHYTPSSGMGDGGNWGYWARAHHIRVDSTPAVGSVAWFAGAGYGHVAYVAEVRRDGTIVTENYNMYFTRGGQRYYTGTYYTQTLARNRSGWPTGFIHFKDLPTTPSYVGTIVQWRNGGSAPNTSWLVVSTPSGPRRRWIPTAAVYRCLVRYGATDKGVQSARVLDSLPDLRGQRASCSPPHAPSGRTWLRAGQGLSRGQTLSSADGRYRLVMQNDANLVLYAPGNRPIWATGSRGGAWTVMQGDGNLVTYTADGRAVWAMGARGAGTALAVQDDGNLVAYRNGRAVWASNTVQR